jgi:hypothetical protein
MVCLAVRHSANLRLPKVRLKLAAAIVAVLAVFTLPVGGGWVLPLERNVCDRTPEGSVWLTVARLTFAEEIFRKAHGRYGSLVEMTDLQPGLPADLTTSGRMGSYTITIEFTSNRYTLRANPAVPRANAKWAWFYADETGATTYSFRGPATPASISMR